MPVWLPAIVALAAAAGVYCVLYGAARTRDVMDQAALSGLRTRRLDQTPHCGFERFYKDNKKGPGIWKWHHYFHAYEREFGRHCGLGGSPVKMIEIGVFSGGSMRMWRHCFGHNLELLVGIDIKNATKSWEAFGDEPGSRPKNVHVEIGSQADAAVFSRIATKYPGGFDVISDDGSHVVEHMVASFKLAFGLLRPGGVYLIEDVTKENVHAVKELLLGGYRYEDTRADLFHALYHNPGAPCCAFTPNAVQRDIEYVTEYPMMLAVRKRAVPLAILEAAGMGTQWVPISQ